jgi:hypothetical protein
MRVSSLELLEENAVLVPARQPNRAGHADLERRLAGVAKRLDCRPPRHSGA